MFPDYIICLEDGKKFKSLKRHLGVHYGLTPDDYREKWLGPRLSHKPNYAEQQSALAKSSELGRKAPEPILFFTIKTRS
ncbi:MucR family transcriptional regulator [Mesorhizobium sp. MSK_1335]|uniref:MucR family transcriptional regulator n=1 Tax=Mesorhizobium montanum TaxID=3072323 RepID=A0ABU4ZUN4_9HYPH|nr:MucR family transcriptional regulator [Mesorhizobium sp. MSK_1335]MDX8529125.1 MucR family transcriptional regulator [Mesorhizobium sp. MSK_1335]